VYCSTCGIDSVEGLKYCKRCGANLTTGVEAPPAKIPVGLTFAFLILIGGVFCVGLGLPMAVSEDLVKIGFTVRDLMFLFMADLLLTLSVVGMLVWLLLRLIKLHHPERQPRAIELSPPAEAWRPQISAPPQSVGSVTENTTRTLNKKQYDTPRSLG
jgi:hypothetical protein